MPHLPIREMTNTETHLVAKYGPVIPLELVSSLYFGIKTYKEACRQAAVNGLPVPTFRLRDSERAPYLIQATALAAWIDSNAANAAADWQHCQIDGPAHPLSQAQEQASGGQPAKVPANEDQVSQLVQLSELEGIVGRRVGRSRAE